MGAPKEEANRGGEGEHLNWVLCTEMSCITLQPDNNRKAEQMQNSTLEKVQEGM